MKKIIYLLLIFSFAVLIRSAFADSLYLKNGTKLDGTVLEATSDGVLFEVYGGKVKFLHSEIERIEKNSSGSTPTPKPALALPASPVAPQENKIQSSEKQLPVERVEVPAPGIKEGTVEGQLNKVKDMVKLAEAARFQKMAISASQELPDLIPSNLQGPGWDRAREHLKKLTNPVALTPSSFEGGALMIWFVQALVILFFSAFIIFAYIWLLRGQVTYWRALWFLVKFNVISNITMVISARSLVPKPGATPGFFEPGGPGLFLLLGFIVLGIFYWFARRDFDSGFFKTTGLLLLTFMAHVAAALGCAYFGLV